MPLGRVVMHDRRVAHDGDAGVAIARGSCSAGDTPPAEEFRSAFADDRSMSALGRDQHSHLDERDGKRGE